MKNIDDPWWEAAVRDVDGEAAEALRETMSPFGRGGAVIEALPIHRALDGGGAAADYRYNVKVFFPDDTDAAAVRRRLEEAVYYLGVIRPLPELTLRRLQDLDWESEYRRHHVRLKPALRLVVLPAWDGAVLAEGELSVRIEPGSAFGAGSHPSTLHCLALLEDTVRLGDSVLDVGCGSGILSVAAARLGAARVVACDLDPSAVQATRECAALNDVTAQVSPVRGSIDAMRGPFDVVVINILAHVIARMATELAAVLSPGGRFVLSGVLLESEAMLQEALRAAGLRVNRRRLDDDWVGLAGTC